MKMDISLSDLRYRIPYGQSRNLLSFSARLLEKDVIESFEKGSIKKRLEQGVLIEVQGSVELNLPLLSVADPQKFSFPNRSKSGIFVEDLNIEEEVESLILADDEELLKELDMEFNEESGVPISVNKKNEKTSSKD